MKRRNQAHNRYFKALMEHRDFAKQSLQIYLPKKLNDQVALGYVYTL